MDVLTPVLVGRVVTTEVHGPLPGQRVGARWGISADGSTAVVEFNVPDAPHGEWELAASSDPGQQVEGAVTTLLVRDASFTLLRSRAS